MAHLVNLGAKFSQVQGHILASSLFYGKHSSFFLDPGGALPVFYQCIWDSAIHSYGKDWSRNVCNEVSSMKNFYGVWNMILTFPPHLSILFICYTWLTQTVRTFIYVIILCNVKLIKLCGFWIICLFFFFLYLNFLIIPIIVRKSIVNSFSLFLCNFKRQNSCFLIFTFTHFSLH